jgi:hypothetical protein
MIPLGRVILHEIYMASVQWCLRPVLKRHILHSQESITSLELSFIRCGLHGCWISVVKPLHVKHLGVRIQTGLFHLHMTRPLCAVLPSSGHCGWPLASTVARVLHVPFSLLRILIGSCQHFLILSPLSALALQVC